MSRLAVAGLVLAFATAAYADHYQTRWPLASGNSWTIQRGSSDFTIRVTQKYYDIYKIDGIPMLGGAHWLGWSGNTLYVWDTGDGRWEEFLRFGAATGTTYDVRLSGTNWSNVRVTVGSKSQTVYNPVLGETHSGCSRFEFQFVGWADAGVELMDFAPYRGPVHTVEQSIAGPRDGWLKRAVLAGKNYGLVGFSSLERAAMSGYDIEGTNKLKLINSQSAWESFYAEHRPGQTAPSVDFSRKTVLVVLAGFRSSGGYAVEVKRVLSNYPYTSIKVDVAETRPSGPAIMVITNPFHIVVLDRKVYTAYLRHWTVTGGSTSDGGSPPPEVE